MDITQVEVIEGHTVRLRFEDGTEKTVDLDPYLYGPVFAEIRRDPASVRGPSGSTPPRHHRGPTGRRARTRSMKANARPAAGNREDPGQLNARGQRAQVEASPTGGCSSIACSGTPTTSMCANLAPVMSVDDVEHPDLPRPRRGRRRQDHRHPLRRRGLHRRRLPRSSAPPPRGRRPAPSAGRPASAESRTLASLLWRLDHRTLD